MIGRVPSIALGLALALMFSLPSCYAAQAATGGLVDSCDASTDISALTSGPVLAWGRDRLLYVHNKQQIDGRTVVDVRPAAEFERGHALGALNLPLHTLITKPYFKQQKLLLMGDGRQFMALEQMAGRLHRELGADVLLLDGSLALWQREYGAVDGIASPDDGRLSLTDYFAERNWGAWLLLDASVQGIAPKMKGRGGQLLRIAGKLSNDTMNSIKAQLSRFAATYPMGRIVLVAEPEEMGALAARLQPLLPERRLLSIEGGSSAVARYLAEHEQTLAAVAEQQTPQYCRPLK